MPSLRIKLPDNKGEITHVLAGDRITIGRRPDNTIQIIDRTVSGHHAELIAASGHYRLHDLGSTNLTCVNGQPITDYHLHSACKVSFGSIECEFMLETIREEEDKPAEIVPTRGELEFLRRENLDLQSKIAVQQKQIDILSSARLITKETTQLGVAPEVHRRIAAERDELKGQNEDLKLSVNNLKSDLEAITRDRDATRQAWETVKAELEAAQNELVALRGGTPTLSGAGSPEPVAMTATAVVALAAAMEPERGSAPLMSPEAHRAMASVLAKAPGQLETVKGLLEKAVAAPDQADTRAELRTQAAALAECTQPIHGHPIQRLSASLDSLLKEDIAFQPATLKILNQSADLAKTLLDPKHLKRAKDLSHPRVLAIDSDKEMLSSVTSALSSADIIAAATSVPEDAIALLHNKHFDLVLLEGGMPNQGGVDLCTKIREIPGCKKTPVVSLGAKSSTAGPNGCDDSISKPFNSVELTVKAQNWIYRQQFGLL